MNYYSKYLKYKKKYLDLKSIPGSKLVKTITKGIPSIVQVVAEKIHNEVDCIANKKNMPEIINKINICREKINDILTKPFYAQIIFSVIGYIKKSSTNHIYTDVSSYKVILRLIIEIVNIVEYKHNKRIFTKSYTSYADYDQLEIFYNMITKEKDFVNSEIEVKILKKNNEIKNNLLYILDNIKCMFHNQLIPLYGNITYKKIDNGSANIYHNSNNTPPELDHKLYNHYYSINNND